MDRLFVYGTLHPDRAPAEIAEVVKNLKPLGTGTIRARLYHFRNYPAIKIGSDQETKVSGHVFSVPNASDLKQLDEYEEFYPETPSKSLFRRTPVTVKLDDGPSIQCWVYEYNRSLPPLKQVRRVKERSLGKRSSKQDAA